MKWWSRRKNDEIFRCANFLKFKGTKKLDTLFRKLKFLDYFTLSFVIVNLLDLFSTLIGISSGKGEETTIILIEIMDSYGLLGLVTFKLFLSFAFLFILGLKYIWRKDFWINNISVGLGISSIILLFYYIQVIINNFLIVFKWAVRAISIFVSKTKSQRKFHEEPLLKPCETLRKKCISH